MGIISDGLEMLKLVNIGANAELYSKMAKFVEEAQELKAKVEKLEDENKALKEQLRFKTSLLRVQGITFTDGDDDPICGRCAEVDNRAVHIHKPAMAVPECPQCKTKYVRATQRSKMVVQASAQPT